MEENNNQVNQEQEFRLKTIDKLWRLKKTIIKKVYKNTRI